METYKFDVKKRKDFESITLKLKDQLEQQISNFEQSFERNSQIYARDVSKNYLPNLIKDANKLNQIVMVDKFLSFGSEEGQDETDRAINQAAIIKEIKDLQKKFSDLQ